MSGATASQNRTYLGYAASQAVDGNFNTHSRASIKYNVGNYWWKIDIGQRIIFTNASIYVRDGKCGPSGALFNCCKYLYLPHNSAAKKLFNWSLNLSSVCF